MQELWQIHLLLDYIAGSASLPLISCLSATTPELFGKQALVGYLVRILEVPIHLFEQLFIGILFLTRFVSLSFLFGRFVLVFFRPAAWPRAERGSHQVCVLSPFDHWIDQVAKEQEDRAFEATEDCQQVKRVHESALHQSPVKLKLRYE